MATDSRARSRKKYTTSVLVAPKHAPLPFFTSRGARRGFERDLAVDAAGRNQMIERGSRRLR